MLKAIKIIVAIVVIAMLGALVGTILNSDISQSEAEEEIILEHDVLETGSITTSQSEDEYYVTSIEVLNTEYSFINERVNTYVQEILKKFKEENYSSSTNKSKPEFYSIIDDYIVNDSIISVRVKYAVKALYEQNYYISMQAFNFRLDNECEIYLTDLFKSGYEEEISQIYTDNYLFKATEIVFFNTDSTANKCSYNELKEYNSSKILTAQNYQITEEEYKELISKVIDPNQKMVAITFDDGPHATNTELILETLSEYNARATFFMVGQNVEKYPDVVKSVYESGSEIGIHTWDHKQLTTLSDENILQEVESTSDAIFNITGYRPTLVRPPYGSINSNVKSVLNYPLILWSIDSLDWKTRDENQIVPLVMDSVQDGDIILLHDIHSTTVPAAQRIIQALYEEGYQMVTVTEMLEAKGYDLTNTKVFYSGRQ